MPAGLEALEASVTTTLNKIATLPLPDLVADPSAIQGVDDLGRVARYQAGGDRLTRRRFAWKALIGTLDQRAEPPFAQAQATLSSAAGWSRRTRRCGTT